MKKLISAVLMAIMLCALVGWSDECVITYKMLDVDPDGWMVGGIAKDCWQVVPFYAD